MSFKLNINQWAEEDRPREKLERLGALSNAELLAILIGSGSTDEHHHARSYTRQRHNPCAMPQPSI